MIDIKTQSSYNMCSKTINSFYIKHVSSGFFNSQMNWTHTRRTLVNYEIIFVTDGDLYIQEEDKQYTLSAGDILILSPYKTSFGFKTSTRKISFYWTRFSTNNLNSFEFASNYIKTFDSYKLNGLFKQLFLATNAPEYPEYTADLLIALILNELSVMQKNISQKSTALIKNVAEWIRTNADCKTTVELVAHTFKYNKDYLCKLFKSSLNVGIKEFINEEKIKRAKNLLLTSNYTIKQIAEILGYDNQNLFIKFFKYHESISPAKYRNINLPANIT
ncbi:MAG: AraC family transcriptional regulator [Clostridia bacterium]|nr:AraC family transcriptional regulator [Clostridia bacterium]